MFQMGRSTTKQIFINHHEPYINHHYITIFINHHFSGVTFPFQSIRDSGKGGLGGMFSALGSKPAMAGQNLERPSGKDWLLYTMIIFYDYFFMVITNTMTDWW